MTAAKAKSKSSVIKKDFELDVTLYAPGSYPSYRITYYDPVTAKRETRSGTRHLDAAEQKFDEICDYVRTTRALIAVRGTAQGDGVPKAHTRTLDALMDLWVEKTRANGREDSYIDGRAGTYDVWIRDRIGDTEVADWTTSHSLAVIAAVRNSTGAARVQTVGALLRSLVTTAQDAGWVMRHAPMKGVSYVVHSKEQSESADYVPKKDRPKFGMVERLADQFGVIGARSDRWWLELMCQVAGVTGARFGEQCAFKPDDYRASDNSLMIDEAWTFPRRHRKTGKTRPPRLKDTKNHKRRRVYLPDSLAPAMARRVAEVEALEIPGALLFPGPAGPTKPFQESNFRSTIFIPAARAAGWEMIGDKETARGLMRGGRAAIPYANMRHHAAMWMRKRAGYDWEDISHYLGHHSVTFTRSVYLRRRSDADKRNRKAMKNL